MGCAGYPARWLGENFHRAVRGSMHVLTGIVLFRVGAARRDALHLPCLGFLPGVPRPPTYIYFQAAPAPCEDPCAVGERSYYSMRGFLAAAAIQLPIDQIIGTGADSPSE